MDDWKKMNHFQRDLKSLKICSLSAVGQGASLKIMFAFLERNSSRKGKKNPYGGKRSNDLGNIK